MLDKLRLRIVTPASVMPRVISIGVRQTGKTNEFPFRAKFDEYRRAVGMLNRMICAIEMKACFGGGKGETLFNSDQVLSRSSLSVKDPEILSWKVEVTIKKETRADIIGEIGARNYSSSQYE